MRPHPDVKGWKVLCMSSTYFLVGLILISNSSVNLTGSQHQHFPGTSTGFVMPGSDYTIFLSFELFTASELVIIESYILGLMLLSNMALINQPVTAYCYVYTLHTWLGRSNNFTVQSQRQMFMYVNTERKGPWPVRRPRYVVSCLPLTWHTTQDTVRLLSGWYLTPAQEALAFFTWLLQLWYIHLIYQCKDEWELFEQAHCLFIISGPEGVWPQFNKTQDDVVMLCLNFCFCVCACCWPALYLRALFHMMHYKTLNFTHDNMPNLTPTLTKSWP